MAELIVGPGDAISRLVQLHAMRNGIRLKWTGHGADDIALLCNTFFNKATLNDCLWNGMKELMQMPELKELPEPVQAKIFSIILQAQALIELKIAARNAKPQPPDPTGAAPSGVPA